MVDSSLLSGNRPVRTRNTAFAEKIPARILLDAPCRSFLPSIHLRKWNFHLDPSEITGYLPGVTHRPSLKRETSAYGQAMRNRRDRLNQSKLINDLKDGDRDAQLAFYEQTVERIYRLILKLTGSETDTFDLIQDIYLRAFQAVTQFRGDASPATWLYRIAINEARQFLRSTARRREIVAELQPAQTFPSAETVADAQMDIQAALTSLGSQDREILLLRYQEGLDYNDIAAILDCAPGTVASRLHRARQQLQPALRKSYEISEET